MTRKDFWLTYYVIKNTQFQKKVSPLWLLKVAFLEKSSTVRVQIPNERDLQVKLLYFLKLQCYVHYQMRNVDAKGHIEQRLLLETINTRISASVLSVLCPKWYVALKINVQFILGLYTGIKQHSSLTSISVNMLINITN